jgi:hypothetical protein
MRSERGTRVSCGVVTAYATARRENASGVNRARGGGCDKKTLVDRPWEGCLGG